MKLKTDVCSIVNVNACSNFFRIIKNCRLLTSLFHPLLLNAITIMILIVHNLIKYIKLKEFRADNAIIKTAQKKLLKNQKQTIKCTNQC